ncbi:polyketide synthase [Sorangium cellulosum]|uniref:Polyketide synthase n=1 Tax=Sorangium cellulosum TaxID=56 RepID=A0A2L0F8G8_SORCE|nr:type I polyketide synthase [Sorangium cellulosum]AUX47812.1 polyketide synthase [Sorangium cellulosum]
MSGEPLPVVKQALLTIKKLQAKLDAEERARTEPIAIIGMACRFPGAPSPDALWELLERRGDAITEVPEARWALDQDAGAARWGAFLSDVDLFDAQFFGISPREAKSMDPQQRLLLEVTWEALERAGQTPEQLAGTRSAVFVGLVVTDYDRLGAAADVAPDMYAITGNGHCFPPGRLSYVLGLEGPSMAVDTACSSSLVAVHLACQSLRSGESSLAVAGGVTLMLSPWITRALDASQALSPDGRCKTFDAQANGFVRGEGCGVLVLKRLSDAVAGGDPVLALIRGSAVNQDGRSTGLTAPNVLAQKALLRQALDSAGVSAADLGYVETHGTGTPLGDPIEMEALSDVVGRPRADGSACVLGAVKTNLGHLEAAAGVASVIKVVLSMQREAIPANLHFKALNPRISLENTPFVIPTEAVPWARGARRRLAGVSSFGMSGTNAHVVLEEAPRPPAEDPAAEEGVAVLPLSARSPAALRSLAQAYRAFLTDRPPAPAWSLRDIAYTAGVRRGHHEHRLALVARSREELCEKLDAFMAGEARPGLAQGHAPAEQRPKVVFVLPGQGSQWPGMGRELLASEPVFRAAIEACDEAIRREAGWSLLDELSAEEGRSRLGEIDVVQPALFAVEVALAALWRSWGVEPDVVVGHSMGEVAAAHVAGALSLEDAARVICRRSKLLRRLSGRGAMAVVELPFAQAEEALAGYRDRLSVAASNSPRSTVLAGEPAALEQVLAALAAEGVFCRRIKVDVASHSPQVDPLLGDLVAALRELAPASSTAVALRSTVTAAPHERAAFDAGYWARNLRAPVRFSQVIQGLIEDGHALFVEMSPHPVLLPSIEEGLLHGGREGAAMPSLRRDLEARRVLLESLATLYARGYPVAWARLYPSRGRCAPLPTYPFQRERYWIDAASEAPGSPRRPRRARGAAAHPLLGASFSVATQPGARFWEQELGGAALSYLTDHRVEEEAVLPAAAYLEMALAAAAEVYGAGPHAVARVTFERMLTLPADGSRWVHVALAGGEAAPPSFQVFTREHEGVDWTRHAHGDVEVRRDGGGVAPRHEAAREIQARCPAPLSAAEHYARMEARAIHYGERFRGVKRLWLGAREALGEVQLPDAVAAQPPAYQLHPALLDACFQVLAALFIADGAVRAGEDAFVPVSVERVCVHRAPAREVWVHARLLPAGAEGVESPAGDLLLLDEDGQLVAEIRGLRAQRLSPDALGRRHPAEEWLYTLDWHRRAELSDPPAEAAPRSPGGWVVLLDRGGTGAALSSLLARRGEVCVQVQAGPRYRRVEPGRYEVDPADPDGVRALVQDALGDGVAWRGVVHLWSLDATAGDATTAETLGVDQRRGSLSALHVARALLQQRWRDPPRLWLVTRGAQPAGAEASPLSIAQAPIWGLGRTLALEHPELGCTRVDLSPAWAPDQAARALVRELSSQDGEDQIALRPGARYVARLARSSFAACARAGAQGAPGPGGDPGALRAGGAAASRPVVRPDGAYLIAGGLGGLGLSLAAWLVAQGARHLALVGRSAATEAAQGAIAALQEQGAEVLTLQADVSRRDDVARVLSELDRRMPPLRGVVHAAMVLEDRTALGIDAALLGRVTAPKVQGAWNLHEATRDRALDFFVMYSSAASLLGPPGQGSYAAANAFLDALAHHRRALGLPALSIDWGMFSEAGSVAARRELTDRVASRGIGGFTPAEGLEVLGRLLAGAPAQIAVVRLDLRQWLDVHPSAAGAPVLSELRLESRSQAPGARPPRFREALAQAGPGERALLLERHLGEELGRILHVDPSRIDRLAAFRGLGVDSLMALELRNRLEAGLGVRLSVALLFAYPTVASLAQHLLDRMALPIGPEEAPPAEGSAGLGADAAPEQLSRDEILALIDASLDRVAPRPDAGRRGEIP